MIFQLIGLGLLGLVCGAPYQDQFRYYTRFKRDNEKRGALAYNVDSHEHYEYNHDRGYESDGYDRYCDSGEVYDAYGRCVRPIVSRNVFVFAAPQLPYVHIPRPSIPKPKIDYNVIFVRAPEPPRPLEPIVVPPPLQKTLVYVLTRNGEIKQRVIEFPSGPEEAPEVIFVNYDEEDNPELLSGLSLHEIISNSGEHRGHGKFSKGGVSSTNYGYNSYKNR